MVEALVTGAMARGAAPTLGARAAARNREKPSTWVPGRGNGQLTGQTAGRQGRAGPIRAPSSAREVMASLR